MSGDLTITVPFVVLSPGEWRLVLSALETTAEQCWKLARHVAAPALTSKELENHAGDIRRIADKITKAGVHLDNPREAPEDGGGR